MPRPPHPPGEGVCGVLNDFFLSHTRTEILCHYDTLKIDQTNNNSLI